MRFEIFIAEGTEVIRVNDSKVIELLGDVVVTQAELIPERDVFRYMVGIDYYEVAKHRANRLQLLDGPEDVSWRTPSYLRHCAEYPGGELTKEARAELLAEADRLELVAARHHRPWPKFGQDWI